MSEPIDPNAWLQAQTQPPVFTTTQPAPMSPAPVTPPVAVVQELQPLKSDNQLFKSAIALGIFIVIAVAIFRFTGSPTKPDDGDTPTPNMSEVTEAFKKFGNEYWASFGVEVEAIGKQVLAGDIDTIDEWTAAHRDAFTVVDDKFREVTGEWANKYVPQGEEKDDTERGYAALKGNGKLSPSDLKKLGNYTVATGKGFQEAGK